MGFPLHRPRRTRQSDAWRRMVRETRLTLDSLIYPLFVVPGRAVKHPISSMPGISQLSVDEAVKEARAVAAAGIPAVLLFAAPAQKDSKGSAALDQGLLLFTQRVNSFPCDFVAHPLAPQQVPPSLSSPNCSF